MKGMALDRSRFATTGLELKHPDLSAGEGLVLLWSILREVRTHLEYWSISPSPIKWKKNVVREKQEDSMCGFMFGRKLHPSRQRRGSALPSSMKANLIDSLVATLVYIEGVVEAANTSCPLDDAVGGRW